MESLLDNWLKNTHIIVDIKYCLCSLLVPGVLTSYFPNLFLYHVNPQRGKETLASKELNTAFYKFE